MPLLTGDYGTQSCQRFCSFTSYFFPPIAITTKQLVPPLRPARALEVSVQSLGKQPHGPILRSIIFYMVKFKHNAIRLGAPTAFPTVGRNKLGTQPVITVEASLDYSSAMLVVVGSMSNTSFLLPCIPWFSVVPLSPSFFSSTRTTTRRARSVLSVCRRHISPRAFTFQTTNISATVHYNSPSARANVDHVSW